MNRADSPRGVTWAPLMLLGIALAVIVYLLADTLSPIIVAAIMAYLLNPLVDMGERRRLPRWLSITLIYLAIAAIFVLIVVFLIPVVVDQFRQLYHWEQRNPVLHVHSIDAVLAPITDRLPILKTFLGHTSVGERFVAAIRGWASGMIERLPTFLTSAVSNLVSVVTYVVMVPFIAFFLLRDGRLFKKAFIELVPNRYFETTLSIIAGVTDSVGRYLRGVLLEALSLGVMVTIGLVAIGLEGGVVVGMVAGLMYLIPYAGAIVGVLVGIFVALATGGNIIGVLIVFAAAQFLDNWVIQPVVLSRSVNLHPLVIFLAVVFGGTYGGLLGMVLGVPIAGAVVVTVRNLREGLRPAVFREPGPTKA